VSFVVVVVAAAMRTRKDDAARRGARGLPHTTTGLWFRGGARSGGFFVFLFYFSRAVLFWRFEGGDTAPTRSHLPAHHNHNTTTT